MLHVPPMESGVIMTAMHSPAEASLVPISMADALAAIRQASWERLRPHVGRHPFLTAFTYRVVQTSDHGLAMELRLAEDVVKDTVDRLDDPWVRNDWGFRTAVDALLSDVEAVYACLQASATDDSLPDLPQWGALKEQLLKK